jgi:5'-nucleotidase
MSIRLLLIRSLFLALGLVCLQADAGASAPLTVRLIAFNDFHGYIDSQGNTVIAPNPAGGTARIAVGGAPYLASLIQRLKAGNPLNAVVGAGDLVGASPLDSALFHDEPTIESLGAMGLEFSSVGNHEFDKGARELRRLQRGGCYPGGTPGVDTCVRGRFAGAKFRYLAANVVSAKTGRTLFPAYAVKSFRQGGRSLRIAFVGVVLKSTPSIVKADGIAGLRFGDEAAAVNALVPRLKALGASAIVVLIHQGGATSGSFDDQSCPNLGGAIVPIVEALDPAVDVVISGHTHTAYVNCSLPAADGRKRILVSQAGSYGHFVTALDLHFDAAAPQALAGIDAHNLPVVNQAPTEPALAALYPALPAEPAQAALVAVYNRRAAPVVGRQVGQLAGELARAPDPAGESALGDVIADAQLAATAKAGGAVAALVHPGGIRGDLPAGTINFGQLFNVQPFGDLLVVISLSGAQIKQVLEEQWQGRRSPSVLQVSAGFHYAWDAHRPEGDRVTALSIGGAPVDLSDRRPRYRIEVNDFIAAGGDGFAAFAGGIDRFSGPRDTEALAAYLGAHPGLSAPAPDRISCSGC